MFDSLNCCIYPLLLGNESLCCSFDWSFLGCKCQALKLFENCLIYWIIVFTICFLIMKAFAVVLTGAFYVVNVRPSKGLCRE